MQRDRVLNMLWPLCLVGKRSVPFFFSVGTPKPGRGTEWYFVFFSLSPLQHFAQLHPCTTSRGTWGLGTLRISGVLVASADATRIRGRFALAQRLLPGAECGSSWRSSTGPVRFMTLRLNTLLQATFHTVPREEEKKRTMALRASAVTPVFLCVVAKFWIVCV